MIWVQQADRRAVNDSNRSTAVSGHRLGRFRRMATTLEAERRVQLLACAEAVAELAEHRQMEPVRPRLVKHDLEIRRVLETVVRRWTKLTPTRFVSSGALNSGEVPLHREHVVPCRLLVERMMMDPAECRALLETAVVIARVTAAEHRQIGGLYPRHENLHRRMLEAPVSLLPELGMERYSATKITLREIS
jgi:hypothetical protein